jgi:antirestriction protein ArdC
MKSTVKRDRAAEIAESILNGLSSNETWNKPWSAIPAHNGQSGRIYKGGNQFILSLFAAIRGYSSNSWFTFKNAIDLGGNVKKGEKSVTIYHYSIFDIKSDNDDENRKGMSLRTFSVFNLDQCEGIDLEKIKVPKGVFSNFTEIEENTPLGIANEFADFLAKTSDIQISAASDKACYSPLRDSITMPARTVFRDNESFYSTLFHEYAHWTGHKDRCNRNFGMGAEEYAEEELVAELCSAMICGAIGIHGELQHQEYFNHWKQRSRPSAILKCARLATEAMNYLFNVAIENGMDLHITDDSDTLEESE